MSCIYIDLSSINTYMSFIIRHENMFVAVLANIPADRARAGPYATRAEYINYNNSKEILQ